MHTRLLGGVTALAIALGALAFPSAEPARAGSSCTGWDSLLRPPTSIRVYRTATKRTETVPFRAYVETVMASEWGATSPAEALRVGAVAAKQYAWYYTMHWRGGRDKAGRCYDVKDTWVDQVYNPKKTIVEKHRIAVAATWAISVRKDNRFFLTGYRAGTGTCTAHIDGWKLYQRDAVDCVRRLDDTTEKLARRFFSNLSWITPGLGDFTGDGRGDLAVLSVEPGTGATTGEVHTTDGDYATGVAGGELGGATLTTAAEGVLLGRHEGDVNRDGREDLVQLVESPSGVALQVMLGTAAGFQPATAWWADALDPAALDAGTHKLVVEDFTGDGRADAGIVRTLPGDVATSALFVARSTGTRFTDVKKTWSAAIDLTDSRVLAGDLSGDGLGDLVVVSPTPDGTTTLSVARSKTRTRMHRSLVAWATEPRAPEDIIPLIGDTNRDGRDDVLVASRRGASALRLVAYESLKAGKAYAVATLAASLPLPFDSSRLSVADINRDGRADVFALVDRGIDPDGLPLGTDGWRIRSSGTTWQATSWFSRPALDWSTAYPY